jgi:2-polyprenyl-3-methyl-5-hydroxy-6-metoxy-1,4-benzoquinol methylase
VKADRAEAGACPACGANAMRRWRTATASDRQLAGSDSFELARCARCGSAKTLGEPPPPALYEGGTYAPARSSAAAVIEPLRRLADRDRMRFLGGIEPGSRVLEVGAGDGRFVALMRAAGLDAGGLDPSPAARAAARAAGLEVAPGGVDDAEVEPASQDAVVLWHSLEHFEDPAAAIGRLRGWLRPEGRLVIAVPNLAGLQARIGGDRWFHQDVPRHRTHFTPAGLTMLLERSGFAIQRLRHLLVEQNPLGMWQTLLNRLTGEREVAFRLIKRDLGGVGGPALARDLAITALAAAPAVPLALALELAAGLAGRGGSMVAEAELR